MNKIFNLMHCAFMKTFILNLETPIIAIRNSTMMKIILTLLLVVYIP